MDPSQLVPPDPLWVRITLVLAPAVTALVGVAISLWHARIVARDARKDARLQERLRHQRAERVRLRQERQKAYVQLLADCNEIWGAYFKGVRATTMAEGVALLEKAMTSGVAARLVAPADTRIEIERYLDAIRLVLENPDDRRFTRETANLRQGLFDLMRRDAGVELHDSTRQGLSSPVVPSASTDLKPR
jgi:hypothetical protein